MFNSDMKDMQLEVNLTISNVNTITSIRKIFINWIKLNYNLNLIYIIFKLNSLYIVITHYSILGM